MRIPILMALLLGSAPVGAEPPMVSQHADGLLAGECEAELRREGARVQGARGRDWVASAGCFVGARTQIGLDWSQGRWDGERERYRGVYSQTTLIERGEGLGVSLQLWAGQTQSGGARWQREGPVALLILTQTLPGERGVLHLNLGHGRADAEGHRPRPWALGLEWTLSERWELLAERVGERGEAPRSALGLRWAASDSWWVGAMHERGRDARRWVLSVQTVF